ncbi:MIP transporter [Aspergillus homomorphus CBS 101889]|uniref:MIP transporter n=1 Tax=Aspergillus homomorphus (strain CBS 101889) TaxID=1450537 RepID=A0A395HYA2_ASPHC|nr:MIP transporter [Aspergillus homomorphus CBS 101889]RAL11838.1 MIP transporter [Aspergillus homomorphus CBS 101889]
MDMTDAKPTIQPFTGRIGGNQTLVVDRNDPDNANLLKRVPDAAPLMTLREGFNLRGLLEFDLWKFGFIECIGTMLNIFITAWASIKHPTNQIPTPTPSSAAGIYSTAIFLGPTVGSLVNWLTLTLCIFTFSNVTGSHLNPTITLATFFARLITLPRALIYLAAQTLGGALAGLILRAAYGSPAFAVGGCSIDTRLVPVQEAFLLEFIFCLILVFFSFGVGLDPRQGRLFGAALSPFLVGMALGVVSWASAFTRVGFGGAGLNPARCFAVYVATGFPGYHWVHWVAALAACVGHGFVYFCVPPWSAGLGGV